MKWRTQDWVWAFVCLIYATGFSFLYKDFVKDVISYVSTFISLALGGVAIYISIREATNGDNVKNETFKLLGALEEKLAQMDYKINKFDPSILNSAKNYTLEEINQKIEEKITELSTEQFSKENVLSLISEANQEVKDALTFDENFENTNQNQLVHMSDLSMQMHVSTIVSNAPSEQRFSAASISNSLLASGRIPNINKIHSYLDKLALMGTLEKEKYYYKKL